MSNSETPTAYPLSWPIGWRRTQPALRARARFGVSKDSSYARPDGSRWKVKGHVSVYEATQRLQAELDRLEARNPVLSTDVELRLDGRPRSDRRDPADPGAACYFRLGGKPRVLACDRWDRVADNIVAISKHIEALRGQDRWGVGSLDQAFAGYAALPSPGQTKPWWQTLGFAAQPTRAAAEEAFRRLAKLHHPDNANGGSHAMMAEINAAIAEARA